MLEAWLIAVAAGLLAIAASVYAADIKAKSRSADEKWRSSHANLRAQMEAQHRESMEFRDAIEAATVGILMARHEKDALHFTYINARAAQILHNPGWGRLTGILRAPLPETPSGPLLDLCRSSVATQTARVIHDVAIGNYWAEVRIIPIDKLVAVILTDTTLQVQQRMELEFSNAQLEDYAYAVSHDLQTPLRHMQGYAGLLEMDDLLEGEAKSHVGRILKAVGRMQNLIEGLLRFSRVRAADAKMHDLDLTDIALQASESFNDHAPDVTIDVQPLFKISGDETHLHSVFENLIGNAIKYRRPEPLHVSIRRAQDVGPHVIVVEDTGRGFEPEYANSIFQMFRRIHQADDVEGTGIGLALVKRIMQLHDGRIWVESDPGVGSRFFLSFDKTSTARGSEAIVA